MIAFHGDSAIKAKYLARVHAHRAADEIVQGQYWENGRGCAVGCTIHGDEHARYESELGIPEAIAHLEDRIFEGLPFDVAKNWPDRFLTAIPAGGDLSLVINRFLLWLLESPEIGLPRIADDRGRAALATVAALHRRHIDGDRPTEEEWDAASDAASDAARAAASDAASDAARAAALAAASDAARAAAWAAASDAARAAARAAAWAAASDAAWAAAWAAASDAARAAARAAAWAAASDAAWAAASDAAWAAAWAAAYGLMADQLIAFLSAVPVVTRS